MKAKITDEQILKACEDGLSDKQIAEKYGMTSTAVWSRRKKVEAKNKPEPKIAPQADGIHYGKVKAAEYIKAHPVDVEGIMAELKKTEVAKKSVEDLFVKDPIETGICKRAEADIADYHRIKARLMDCINTGQALLEPVVESYNDLVREYGGADD